MFKINKIQNIFRISLALARVNFRLRIEGSYLGILWYLLNPLILFSVLFFVKEAAFSEVHIPYFPLYLLIGISGFNFFKQAITNSIKSINTNYEYIKSINNIAPETLVISSVFEAAFSHIFEFLMIVGMALYLQIPLSGLIIYPFIFFTFFLLTLGIAFIFATIGVYVSDLDNIWIILSQLLLLATPIFYILNPLTIVYRLNLLNPLFYFLELSRGLIIKAEISSYPFLATMIIAGFIFFASGIFVFKAHQKKFAELL